MDDIDELLEGIFAPLNQAFNRLSLGFHEPLSPTEVREMISQVTDPKEREEMTNTLDMIEEETARCREVNEWLASLDRKPSGDRAMLTPQTGKTTEPAISQDSPYPMAPTGPPSSTRPHEESTMVFSQPSEQPKRPDNPIATFSKHRRVAFSTGDDMTPAGSVKALTSARKPSGGDVTSVSSLALTRKNSRGSDFASMPTAVGGEWNKRFPKNVSTPSFSSNEALPTTEQPLPAQVLPSTPLRASSVHHELDRSSSVATTADADKEVLPVQNRLPLSLSMSAPVPDMAAYNDVVSFLTELYSHINTTAKAKAFRGLQPNDNVCVLTMCVTGVPSSEWPVGEQKMVACKLCTATYKQGQEGEEAKARPCGVVDNGRVWVLPLPESERVGKQWNERGYWLNRA